MWQNPDELALQTTREPERVDPSQQGTFRAVGKWARRTLSAQSSQSSPVDEEPTEPPLSPASSHLVLVADDDLDKGSSQSASEATSKIRDRLGPDVLQQYFNRYDLDGENRSVLEVVAEVLVCWQRPALSMLYRYRACHLRIRC